MADYQLVNGFSGVQRTADAVWIPNDPRNRDWQAYQAWLAVPNTPDPAPVIVPPTAQQLAQFLTTDPSPVGCYLRGLTVLLAQKLSLTPAQVVTAIVNAAS
jgi:hypothetical protein